MDFPTSQAPLAGAKIVVVGGTNGIGKAVALSLAKEGASLFICGRDPERLAEAIAEIQKIGGVVHGAAADIARAHDIQTLFASADAALSGLDACICAAALGLRGDVDASGDEWRRVLETNFNGTIACVREAASRMKKRQSGHIVIIGSMSAEVWEEGSSHYVATKGGLRAFAGCVRKELDPLGVGVTLIEPGATATDMQPGSPASLQEQIRQHEMLSPNDVAETIVFVLTRPQRCRVVTMQLRPQLQLI